MFWRLRGKQPMPNPDRVSPTQSPSPSRERSRSRSRGADEVRVDRAHANGECADGAVADGAHVGAPLPFAAMHADGRLPPSADGTKAAEPDMVSAQAATETTPATPSKVPSEPLAAPLPMSPPGPPPGRRSLVGTPGCRRPSLAARRSFGAGVSAVRVRRSLAAVASRKSFVHREFANPMAETCWLSSLFQSLWHSVVFHTTFDRHLTREKYTAGQEEMVLKALQQTWEDYATGRQDHGDMGDASAPHATQTTAPLASQADPDSRRLVSASDLVEAFGEGYGDMADALATIQEDLSQSPNPHAVALSDVIVMVPVTVVDSALPTPQMAWSLVGEWGATDAPVIAVDLSVLEPSREESESLARLWVPGSAAIAATPSQTPNLSSDLGPGHRLVALVCYMWNIQHYVSFCRRQADPDRCLFFNDLPELTAGAPRELEWGAVPAVCNQFSMSPRLALYESIDRAQECVRGTTVPALGASTTS